MGKITVTEQASTPSTPSTDNRSLYPKADGWYDIDDAGTEQRLNEDATAIHDNVANEISAITEKTTIADDDLVIIEDSAAAFVKKKVKSSNLSQTLWETYAEGIRPKNNTEIAVGQFDEGAEAVFGMGDSHQEGLVIFTYDGTSYADVSANGITQGDGNYVEFPNTNANSAIYVGCEANTTTWYAGIKLNITQIINIGSGSVVKEYYNGSAWVEFTTMATESDFPYQSKGEGIGATLGSFQLRYNHFLANDWTPVLVNGKTLYFTRYRIVTSITQSLRLDFIKLHTSRTEINATGFMEFFGWARPIRQFFLDYGSFQAAVASPANNDVYISDNIDVGRIENEFQSGTVDRSGFTKILPLDLDTSTPIKLRFKYIVDGPNAGDIKFVIRWGLTRSGDGVYDNTIDAPSVGANEQSISAVVPISASSENTEIIQDVYLPISAAIPELGSDNAESIWISFERTGSDAADTLNENVIMTDIECYYIAWRLGGMVTNY